MKDKVYYVYLLLNPKKYYLPFYVGKGKDDRWQKHLIETSENTCNRHKYNTIQSIKNSGFKIPVYFWQIDIAEDDAYNLEEKLIKKFGRKLFNEEGILTNICESSRPPDQTGKKFPSISVKQTGRKLASETCQKISQGLKEFYRENPCSDEYRNRMSQTMKEYAEKNPKRYQSQEFRTLQARRRKRWDFNIQSPDGDIFLVLGENIKDFCKNNNFSKANIIRYGKTKGWILLEKIPVNRD